MISEFPLFVFTTFAGLSAGAYVAGALFPAKGEQARPWLFQLLCLVLLAIGALGVLFHLGRPTMFLNALSNPSAGIAQEAYLTIIYGILLVIDLIVVCVKKSSLRVLDIVTAIAGVILTVVMGLAYMGNLGVEAWVSWATVPLFVAGDLAMGFALYALIDAGAYKKPAFLGVAVVAEIVFAISLIGEILHFSGLGLDIAMFVIALVVAPVAASVLAIAGKNKDGVTMPAAAFVCALVGVCIARWAFYAAFVM